MEPLLEEISQALWQKREGFTGEALRAISPDIPERDIGRRIELHVTCDYCSADKGK